MIRKVSGITVLAVTAALNLAQPRNAFAWGDEGHEVVAFVAQSFLEPDVRKRVSALLAADTDSLTAHDIASEATWADKFRDANIDGSRDKTRQWHFVDIEIGSPDLDAACFNHPPVPTSSPASAGPKDDGVVDKIQEFAAELADSNTDLEESRSWRSSSPCISSAICISRCTAPTITTTAAISSVSPPRASRPERIWQFFRRRPMVVALRLLSW